MTFDFNKLVTIGFDKWKTAPFRFYGEKEPFFIGNKIEQNWRDVILSGNTALTLVNSKANGLNWLRLVGATEQHNLPSEYTQVESLANTSGAYIATSISLDDNDEIEFWWNAKASGSVFAFSQGASTDNQAFQLANTSNNGVVFDIQNYNPYRVVTNVQAYNNGVKHIVIKNREIFIDGVSYGTSQGGITNPTDVLRLFISSAGTTSLSKFTNRFTVKNKINLIFCRRNSDSELGMYDTVSNTFLTNAGTGSFTAGSEVTAPTPDHPIDIVSNNGVLKAKHQSGLPLGYTKVEYIQSSGTQYIDPQVTGNARWVITAQTDTIKGSSQSLISSTLQAAGGTWYGEFTNTRHWDIISGGTDISPTTKTTADLTFDGDGVRGTIGSTSVDRSTSVTQGTWRIFNTTNGSYPFAGKLFDAKVYQGGVLVRNFIPAKNSSNVVGMFDLVSQTFFTNQGTDTFTAGSPVSDPVEIYTDGTVETVEVYGKNLFDQTTATRYRTSWTNSGNGAWQVVSDSSEAVTYGCYVNPNTTYTLSKKGGARLIITGYTTKTEPSSEQTTPADYKIKTDTTETIDGSYTFTTPADCTWILFGLRQNNSTFTFPYDVQLELGSTATEYEPYFNGGSATAEMLLKVGNYQDIQSVLDGEVTRKVGVKVLDGTEDWTENGISGENSYRFILDNINSTENAESSLCTHIDRIIQANTVSQSIRPCARFTLSGRSFVWYEQDNTTTLEQFKQWLADQYAAGTPCIVIYPLSSPITESVSPQPLTIQQGTNIIEITEASMDNLGLEVSYKAGVSVTITEVQNANLSNQVTVTIGG